MLSSSLKEKLSSDEIIVGTFLTFNFWAGHLEIQKKLGMDFVALDLEHGSADLKTTEELCRTARLLDLPLIVRPEASVYHLVRKYADMGPAGFLIPWVDQAEQMQTVKDAVFVHPRGRRGPGGASIFGATGLDLDGWQEVEDNSFVAMQVETPRGIEVMGEMAALDWIDAIMLGPYDLSLNIGHCGEWDHPVVVEAIMKVLDQSQQLGKPCGMPVGSVEQTRFWMERGFRFFLYSEPTIMARLQAEAYLREIKK